MLLKVLFVRWQTFRVERVVIAECISSRCKTEEDRHTKHYAFLLATCYSHVDLFFFVRREWGGGGRGVLDVARACSREGPGGERTHSHNSSTHLDFVYLALHCQGDREEVFVRVKTRPLATRERVCFSPYSSGMLFGATRLCYRT